MIAAPSPVERLKVNPRWAKLPLFDRKGWKMVRFGEFAESVNERVEPADAADEIYVGLDDLDSGSLHIRRWGKGSDVIGTKLRFRKGDIIFGRRRASKGEADSPIGRRGEIVTDVSGPLARADCGAGRFSGANCGCNFRWRGSVGGTIENGVGCPENLEGLASPKPQTPNPKP